MESSEKDQWRNFQDARSRTHGSGKPSVLQGHVWKRITQDKVLFLESKSVLLDSAFDTINPRLCKGTVNRVELVWLDWGRAFALASSCRTWRSAASGLRPYR
jgi:hypothetical protein